MPNENNNSSEFDDLFSTSDLSDAGADPFSTQDDSVDLDVADLNSDSGADLFDSASFGLEASPDDPAASVANSFDSGADAPFGASSADGFAAGFDAASQEESSKGKKGKKAKKEKKAKPAKADAKKSAKKEKAPKAPKTKSEYVASPAPVFLFGTLIFAFLAVVNGIAYSIGGASSYVFLAIFDALGLVAMSVPGMLLKLLRQRRIEIFDMFLAVGAVLSVASVMVLFAYWAKTYSGTTKVVVAPAATVLDEASEPFLNEIALA